MKKIFLVIFSLLFVFVLTACEKVGENAFNQARIEGNLGAFSLKTPTNNGSVKTIPTFEWNASENAETYILEVASSTEFNQQEDTIYVKKAGISETTFKLFSNLKYKNYTYYWRVTAINKDSKKVCNEVFSFFYEANLDEEIEYDIEHADEWEVHKEGSPVNVSIDSTNFFGNDKKALKIDFTHEIMNASNDITHDGWAVVTHHQEEEMYGVDAFYFEFYYSGQDSSIWFRCVDEDNEYYNAEIKVANNTKQQVIIKFDDFTLRTKGGTPIVNQKFDYNMIKYVELVFEKTFGDGTCYVSNIKAINFDKYRYLFLDQLDFNEIDSDDIMTDNYVFRREYSEDGAAFTMSFGSDISGYGFTKFNINKFVEAKNALKVNVEYQGPASGKILLRIIEEDKDRWVYKQDSSAIPEDGYLIIPIQAFTLSEYNGNGAREFYYIKQFQFGIEGVYGSGSITFSDIEFVNLEDEIDNLYKASVGTDGLIENFNNYKANAELYYKWIISNNNKDEAIATNKTYQMGNNNLCGELTYKSDMFGAQYGLAFDKVDKGYTSVSFKALDKSIVYSQQGVTKFNYLEDAYACLAVYLITEEHTFKYVIKKLAGEWTKYVIALSDFKLYEETLEEGAEEPILKSEDILGFGLELSYYYYLENGKADPVYTSNNHVYFDDIYFTKETETSVEGIYTKVTNGADGKAVIDNFNNYRTSEDVLNTWGLNDKLAYSKLEVEELSEDNYCLKMQYKGNSDSVSYEVPTLFAANTRGKAIVFDLKGDGKNNTFYVNIFVNVNGSTLKLRTSITGVTDEWKRYTIGFENFQVVEGSPSTFVLTTSNVPNVQKITFGIKNYSDYNLSYFYLDNLCFDANASYTANTAVVIGE